MCIFKGIVRYRTEKYNNGRFLGKCALKKSLETNSLDAAGCRRVNIKLQCRPIYKGS